MNTRRVINKILKSKNLNAESHYDRAGPGDYGWWTITFAPDSAEFIRNTLCEPEFTGSIEFCELEDGLLQLNEMPERVL